MCIRWHLFTDVLRFTVVDDGLFCEMSFIVRVDWTYDNNCLYFRVLLSLKINKRYFIIGVFCG